MKKNSILIHLLLFSIITLPLQSQSWQTILDPVANYSTPILHEASDMSILLSVRTGGAQGTYFAKLNNTGDLLWEFNNFEGGKTALTTNDELIWVSETEIWKYDSDGMPIWNSTFAQENYAVGAHSDGGFVVAGFNDPSDAVIQKFDGNNQIEWSLVTSIESSTNISVKAKEIKELPSGHLLMTSYNPGKVESNVVLIDKNGNEIWNHLVPNTDTSSYHMVKTEPMPDGGFLTAGTALIASPGLPRDAVVARIGSDGQALWQKQYYVLSDDAVTDLITSSSGRAVVVGWSMDIEGPAGQVAVFVIGIDDTGEELWRETYWVPFDSDYFDPATMTPTLHHWDNSNRFLLGWTAIHPITDYRMPAMIQMDYDGNILDTLFLLDPDIAPIYTDGKALGLIPTSDGAFAATGILNQSGSNSEQVFVVKSDAQLPVSIEEKPIANLNIYPNPANEYLFIETSESLPQGTQFVLTDVLGQSGIPTKIRSKLNCQA